MKKLLLLSFSLFVAAQSYAQDPDLYQTWHLYELAADLEPSTYVSDVQPGIHPYLIINQDLSFEGYGACNNFIGGFVYDSVENALTPTFFDATLNLCDYQEHSDFEVQFFGYVSVNSAHYISLSIDPITNEGELYLTFGDGWYARYRTAKLSISEQNLVDFNIHPNPVSDQLFISSEKLQIEKISIYSMSGKEVLSIEKNEKSIDVSNLSEGLYFIEVTSPEGKSQQKFIKN